MAVATCGEEILWMTGFGSTETAPFALSTGSDGAFSGLLGLPAPGLELKLAPVGSKMEARGRGPSITPGYWRQAELTRAAFDEEGFYRLGDAMRLVDPGDPRKGLLFDGRLAEDFKLSSGTWVSVGPLRARILAAAEGFAFDAVIAAPDRDAVCALIFPNARMCRELAADAGSPLRRVLDIQPCAGFRRCSTGSRARGPAARRWSPEPSARRPPSIDTRDHRQGVDRQGRPREPVGPGQELCGIGSSASSSRVSTAKAQTAVEKFVIFVDFVIFVCLWVLIMHTDPVTRSDL